MAAAAVIPVLVSAWRIARTSERRVARWALIGLGALVLIGVLTAGVAAYESRRHLQSAADLAESGLDQLRDGDTEAAADTFSKAQFQFERASSQLDGPLGLVGRVVPVVAPNLEAMRRVSASGEDLGFTASQAAAKADWRDLTALDGRVDLEKVRSMQDPIAESSAALDAALATVADVRSPWLLPQLDTQLDRFDEKISDAADEASIAAQGLQVAPALLGGDGPRRYLVVFATPGESRNAGGFAGAFAVVEADDGKLTVTRTGSHHDRPRSGRHARTSSSSRRTGTTSTASYEVERFPGNLTASPDWPTDADVAAQIYEQAPAIGAPIDGVIYADPDGPGRAPQRHRPGDGPRGSRSRSPADNAEQYLLLDQYVQYQGLPATADRKEVLGDVAKAVFDALTSRPLPGSARSATPSARPIAGGHLRSAPCRLEPAPSRPVVPRQRAAVRALRPWPGVDYLSLRSSNLVASKLDVFLSRTVTATVEIDPQTGALRTIVEVGTGERRPGTRASRLRPRHRATLVPRGTNLDLLSLYTPLDLDERHRRRTPVGVQSRTGARRQRLRRAGRDPGRRPVTVRYVLEGPPPAALASHGHLHARGPPAAPRQPRPVEPVGVSGRRRARRSASLDHSHHR